MFMRIVQRLNGKMVYLYIRLCTLVKEHLLLNANNLLAKFFQASQDVANQSAKNVQNLKASLVNQIIADPFPKPEPTNVQAEITLLGLQPQTIAPQILPAATPAQTTKQRHAERTKSGKFAPKGTGVAQTHTDSQLQEGGKSLKTAANQRRQRATQAFKKGN